MKDNGVKLQVSEMDSATAFIMMAYTRATGKMVLSMDKVASFSRTAIMKESSRIICDTVKANTTGKKVTTIKEDGSAIRNPATEDSFQRKIILSTRESSMPIRNTVREKFLRLMARK